MWGNVPTALWQRRSNTGPAAQAAATITYEESVKAECRKMPKEEAHGWDQMDDDQKVHMMMMRDCRYGRDLESWGTTLAQSA